MEKSKAEEIISSSYLEAEQLLQNSENHSLPKFEQFLIEYGRKLHPENLIMIRIKHSLCGFYGRYPGFTMNDMAMNPKQSSHVYTHILTCFRYLCHKVCGRRRDGVAHCLNA